MNWSRLAYLHLGLYLIHDQLCIHDFTLVLRDKYFIGGLLLLSGVSGLAWRRLGHLTGLKCGVEQREHNVSSQGLSLYIETDEYHAVVLKLPVEIADSENVSLDFHQGETEVPGEIQLAF